MLSEPSIRRAIEHLTTIGDTDLFPRLPEMRFFAEEVDEVVGLVAQMNLGGYNPVSSVEVLNPKSALGFRIGHQLTAADSLVYAAAVLETAPGIEAMREASSGETAFAYRYDQGGGARFFQAGRTFHDWLGHLSEFGGGDLFEDNRPVLETDVSDFYQRIYIHRVENILKEAGANRQSFGLIKKVIQVCRSKQSFGLPVGSSASRLLAEGVLSDTDRMLRDLRLEVTRFVDDFRIIASPQLNTHTILCRLAEHLMVTEGLSLNVAKTRIVDTASMRASAQGRLQDVFSSAEMRALSQMLAAAYGEEEEHDEDLPAEPDNPFLDGNDLLDRLDELDRRETTDYSSRKAILKVLRRFPGFDVMRLVRSQGQLAYYLPRDFCRAIQATANHPDTDRLALAEAVWQLLITPPISELAFARMWLLSLYADGSLPPDRRIVLDYPAPPSTLEERQLIFVRARLEDRAYFRENRGRLGQAGEWLKPALLIGARCLPADEYNTWIDIAVRQVADPFARAFGNWLQKRHPLEHTLAP